jgi:transcriptional regulator GlxA family with amidase domain
MRESFTSVHVQYDQHVVEHGRVVTRASISAGIDVAPKVVARHRGEDTARVTAKHIEYP